MDRPTEPRAMYYTWDGNICESPLLRDSTLDAATGEIWTTSGERILFKSFHAYTSIDGFAAYVHKDDEEYKSVLINRACISRIFID